MLVFKVFNDKNLSCALMLTGTVFLVGNDQILMEALPLVEMIGELFSCKASACAHHGVLAHVVRKGERFGIVCSSLHLTYLTEHARGLRKG